MERWDIYDAEGNKTGRTRARGEAQREGEYGIVVCVWPISPDGRMLIQQRSMEKEHSPGIWCSTGGGVIAGETVAQACVRETMEEIGLRITEGDLVHVYRGRDRNTFFDYHITFAPFSIKDAVLDPHEVECLRWATPDEVRMLIRNGEYLIFSLDTLDPVEAAIKAHLSRSE